MIGQEREALKRELATLAALPIGIGRSVHVHREVRRISAALAVREEPSGETCDHCGKLAVESVHGEDGFTLCPTCACVLAVAHEDTERPDAEALARRFHETYERLAPEYGYQTREASAVPWDDVPEANKGLMIAVCGELLDAVRDTERPDEAERYRKALERADELLMAANGALGRARAHASYACIDRSVLEGSLADCQARLAAVSDTTLTALVRDTEQEHEPGDSAVSPSQFMQGEADSIDTAEELQEAQSALDQAVAMANDLGGEVAKTEAQLQEALDLLARTYATRPLRRRGSPGLVLDHELEVFLRGHGRLTEGDSQ